MKPPIVYDVTRPSSQSNKSTTAIVHNMANLLLKRGGR